MKNLSNFRGDVQVVLSDRRLPQQNSSIPDSITSFTADVWTAQDYYAFGMLMPGRTWESTVDSGYRFGFGGKEKIDEISGSGNALDFGARIYDSRLGRWMSVDPLAGKTPDWTPFRAFFNNPIIFIDPNGETEFYSAEGKHLGSDNNNNNLIAIVNNKDIEKRISKEYKKKGEVIEYKQENLPEGYGAANRNGILVVDYDVLKYANQVLKSQLTEKGKDGEFAMELNQDENRKFQPSEMANSSSDKLSNEIFEDGGDVSIHGHPTKLYMGLNKLEEGQQPKVPSTKENVLFGEGNDKETFKKYNTNVIVGKNLSYYFNPQKGYEKIHTPAINFYDTNTNPIGEINGDTAKKIIENENK